jgi:hypothetical protein
VSDDPKLSLLYECYRFLPASYQLPVWTVLRRDSYRAGAEHAKTEKLKYLVMVLIVE